MHTLINLEGEGVMNIQRIHDCKQKDVFRALKLDKFMAVDLTSTQSWLPLVEKGYMQADVIWVWYDGPLMSPTSSVQ